MRFVVALHYERPIDPQSIPALYDLEHWWPDRTLEGIASVVEQGVAMGVWDEQQLIAFVRVVTDGLYRAYSEDVVVHPDYRHQGIAGEMLSSAARKMCPALSRSKRANPCHFSPRSCGKCRAHGPANLLASVCNTTCGCQGHEFFSGTTWKIYGLAEHKGYKTA